MTRQKKNIIARIALALTSAFITTMKPLSPSSKTPPSLKRTAAPGIESQPYAKHTAIRPEAQAKKSFKNTSEPPVPEYILSPGSVIYPLPEMTADQIAQVRYNEAPEPSPPDWIADDGSLVYVLDDFTLDPPEKTIPSSSIVAIGAWEKTHPPDPILRQIAICFDLEDGRDLHLTVDTDSAALMAKSILDHLNRSSEPPRLTAPGKTILCSGRFEMNDHGEILLDPVSGENPDWFFWASGPNPMEKLDSLSVSSGVLYFTKADPSEPSHTPGVFQLSGIADPCLSLPITDMLDKAMMEYLKPESLKANVPGGPTPVPSKNKTPTPKENPMNELAEIREKIELVNLEIKALERLFQIVSTRVRSLKDESSESGPEPQGHANPCERQP